MTLTFDDIQFFNAGIVTTDTEGDGPITLGAAVSGYNPSGIPDTIEGLSTYLWVRKDAEYEILRCTIESSVATVVEVVESTNGGAKIDWGAGEKTVVAAYTEEVFELIKAALDGKADAAAIEGLNERMRRYVVMYSQLMKDIEEDSWVFWSRVMNKPEAFPPEEHGHLFSDFGVLDYKSDVLVNKPTSAPLAHTHQFLNKQQKRQAVRRAYMYGGL